MIDDWLMLVKGKVAFVPSCNGCMPRCDVMLDVRSCYVVIKLLGKSFFFRASLLDISSDVKPDPITPKVWCRSRFGVLLSSSNTPMSVEDPSTFLALFAAVLRPPTPSAFRKLPCKLLPFPTLIVCTLPYASSWIIFPAQVPHHNPSPVLHILTVVSYCELLDQWEDVKIIWQKIFFLFRIAGRDCGWRRRWWREWATFIDVK